MVEVIPIRTTQVLGCPRSYQYLIRGQPQLPPHFDTAKGNLIHYVVEKALKGEKLPDFDGVMKENVIEEDSYLQNQLLGNLTHLFENLQKWVRTTKIKLDKKSILGVEEELCMPIKDGYELVGHIDLLTKTHLIDFKSGSVSYNQRYKMQLGIYRELARYNGLQDYTKSGDWILLDVFLGNDKPVSYGPTISEVEQLLPHYYDLLFQFIEYDKKIRANPKFQAPCVGNKWLCVYCPFINNPCRGV